MTLSDSGRFLTGSVLSMRYRITDLSGDIFELGVEDGLWVTSSAGPMLDLSDFVAVSGLADSHVHVSSDDSDFVPSDRLRIRQRLVAEMEGGVFLCLDKGWSDAGVLAILNDPLEHRPSLRAAGPIVAAPGGYYTNAVDEVAAEDLVARVAAHPRAGGWLKIIGARIPAKIARIATMTITSMRVKPALLFNFVTNFINSGSLVIASRCIDISSNP